MALEPPGDAAGAVTVTLGQPLAPDRAVLDGLLDQIAAASRWSNDGPVVRLLETTLAGDLGWAQVVATASGTTALTLALLALDLPPGAEVITTPLTFAATAQAIEAAGLVPVFAGVDAGTLTLDPAAVRSAIGPRTGAVLPVHLFGVAADPALDALGAEMGLPVVYDAAHAYAFPAIAGRGAATAYSLHATKLLHTGEGGLVATDDAGLGARARTARNFGLRDGDVVRAGTNGKLPELSAALGLAIRPRLGEEIAGRQRLRLAYARALAAGSHCRPHAPGHARALVMEAVRCAPSDQHRLLDDLADRGAIGRRFPALSDPGQRYDSVRLVGAAAADMALLARSVVALPLHGRVTEADAAAICEVLARR